MTIDKETAIASAVARIVHIYPDAQLLRAKIEDNLEEFAGRSGWSVVFHVVDDLFGPCKRPVVVDGETGEARAVVLLL